MSDQIQDAIRAYRMSVIGHRLRKFGFERSINKLNCTDLRALLPYLWPHQQDAVQREIEERESACTKTVKG